MYHTGCITQGVSYRLYHRGCVIQDVSYSLHEWSDMQIKENINSYIIRFKSGSSL